MKGRCVRWNGDTFEKISEDKTVEQSDIYYKKCIFYCAIEMKIVRWELISISNLPIFLNPDSVA